MKYFLVFLLIIVFIFSRQVKEDYQPDINVLEFSGIYLVNEIENNPVIQPGDEIEVFSNSILKLNFNDSLFKIEPFSTLEINDNGFKLRKGKVQIKTEEELTLYINDLKVESVSAEFILQSNQYGVNILVITGSVTVFANETKVITDTEVLVIRKDRLSKHKIPQRLIDHLKFKE